MVELWSRSSQLRAQLLFERLMLRRVQGLDQTLRGQRRLQPQAELLLLSEQNWTTLYNHEGPRDMMICAGWGVLLLGVSDSVGSSTSVCTTTSLRERPLRLRERPPRLREPSGTLAPYYLRGRRALSRLFFFVYLVK